MGFASHTVTDSRRGIETTTRYEQTFPYAGRMTSRESMLFDGTVILQESQSWAATETTPGSWSVVPDVRIEELFGIDGLRTSYVRRTDTYDSYGNLRSRGEAIGSPTISSVSTYFDFEPPDEDLWLVARKKSDTVFASRIQDYPAAYGPYGPFKTFGLPIGTRTTTYTTNSENGFLVSSTVEPNDPSNRIVDQVVLRDDFGRITVQIRSGPTFETAITHTNYAGPDPRFPFVEKNSEGHQTLQRFDDFGRVESRIELIDAYGAGQVLTSSWEYDELGREIVAHTSDGTRVDTEYVSCDGSEPIGCSNYVHSGTDEFTNSDETWTYFDSVGQPIWTAIERDGRRSNTRTRFDDYGRIEAESLPFYDGDPVYERQVSFDDIGRKLVVTEPDQSSTTVFSYDGLETTIRNQLNFETVNIYDETGLLVSVRDAEHWPDGLETRYRYDEWGKASLIFDMLGSVYEFWYDDRGHMTSMEHPDRGSWSFQTDALGNVLSETDARGRSVNMTYDTLGRMLTRSDGEGITTWLWDSSQYGIGRLGAVSDTNGNSRSFDYDALGRISGDTHEIAGEAFPVGLGYDNRSRPATVTYPDGQIVHSVYDDNGDLLEVHDVTTGVVLWSIVMRDADGRATEVNLGNGVTEEREYDAHRRWIRRIALTGPHESIARRDYLWDVAGRLEHRIGLFDGEDPRLEHFVHDAVNRVKSAQVYYTSGLPSSAQTWEYDALGNVRESSDAGVMNYDRNRLESLASGESFPHDDNGNQLEGFGRVLTYTDANRVATASLGAASANFVYGPARELLIASQVGPNPKTTKYAGAFVERIHEIGTASKTRNYIYAGNRRLAVREVEEGSGYSTLTYMHSDHLSSTIALTDAVGAVVSRMSYDAFGVARNLDWSVGSPILPVSKTDRLFTGQRIEPEFNLYDFGARRYDAAVNRFIQPDPVLPALEDPRTINPYSYALSNPLARVDPTGLESEWFDSVFGEQGILGSFASGTPGSTPGDGTLLPAGAVDSSQASPEAEKVDAATINAIAGASADTGSAQSRTVLGAITSANDYLSRNTIALAHMIGSPMRLALDASVALDDAYGAQLDSLTFASAASCGPCAVPGFTLRGALGGLSSLGRIGIRGRGVVSNGAAVTDDLIRLVMRDAPFRTDQAGVSVPMIRRYVDRLAAGEVAPAIRVADGVVVEGNHRYIAGRLFGSEPSVQAGTRASHRTATSSRSFSDLFLDSVDWGGK